MLGVRSSAVGFQTIEGHDGEVRHYIVSMRMGESFFEAWGYSASGPGSTDLERDENDRPYQPITHMQHNLRFSNTL